MAKKGQRKIRTIKPILHIFCEGEKTEPEYIRSYLERFHSGSPRIRQIQVKRTNKNTPVQLVDEAIKLKKSAEVSENDEFWVVYDRENTNKVPDQAHRKALDKAGNHGIKLALSNICFELWILLHLTSAVRCHTNCDDLIKNSSLISRLSTLGIDRYEKHNCRLMFSKLRDEHFQHARTEAPKVNRQTINAAPQGHEKPYQFNPYTDMYQLLDAIDRFAQT